MDTASPSQSIKKALSGVSTDAALIHVYNYLIQNPNLRNMRMQDFMTGFMPNIPAGFRSAIVGKYAKALEDLANVGFLKLENATGAVSITANGLEYIFSNESLLLQISEFPQKSKENDEWEPLPVEITDDQKADALKKVEELAERVRGDNGFAVSDPVAHAVTVSTLDRGISLIKSDRATLSEYIAVLRKPIGYLAKKFTDSAIGKLAEAALSAMREWLPF